MYRVLVHLIEAREVQGTDLNGSCDPCVFAKCFGAEKRSAVRPSTRNPVFDQTLFFESSEELSEEQLGAGALRLRLYDMNSLLRDEVVGEHTIDLALVYHQLVEHAICPV